MPVFTAVFLTVAYVFGRSRSLISIDGRLPRSRHRVASPEPATAVLPDTELQPAGQPSAPPDAAAAREPLRHPDLHRVLLGCGIAGPVLFVAAFLAEGAMRPDYDSWYQPISALSLGPGGWAQRTNFLAFGVLTACWSVSLRGALGRGTAADWVPPMQGAGAFGLVLDGIFSQDPVTGYPLDAALPPFPTVHAILHLQGSIITFAAVPVCCVMLAHRFARAPGWRGWAAYSAVTGVGFTVLVMLFIVTATGMVTGPAGMFEKLAAILMALFGTAFSTRLLLGRGRVPPPAADATSPGTA